MRTGATPSGIWAVFAPANHRKEAVMRALEGKQLRVRVVVGESDRWHHRPLHLALLERLRREGCAGTTVTRGIAGFGAHSVVYNAQLARLSEDLPVVIEVVDSEPQVEKVKAILDEMVTEGLVTIEPVTVLRYSARPRA
jgi:PII-like signaling protein